MKKTQIESFEQAVAYILDVPKFTKKNSMEDTKLFLKKLGSFERELKVIHIAGTNGKGSVCAYLCSILKEGGFSTGMFTSPHLVDIRERFKIDGNMISKERFLEAFLEIYNKLDDAYHPTFFEYLFFMAVLIFRNAGVDYCIMETGLGGRLDATNSIEKKEACVITKIGFDHMEYLGDTLEQIAGEKAGILRPDTPVVYYAGKECVNDVIEKQAKDVGSVTLPIAINRDAISKIKNKSIDFSFHSRYYDYVELCLSTSAIYQVDNAALAVETIGVIGLKEQITCEQLKQGIQKAFWEGRMEEVVPGVYVDGAHNEDGVEAFLESVRQDGCMGQRHLLFSVVQDKKFENMVSALLESGLFAKVGCAALENSRAVSKEALEALFAQYKDRSIRISFYESVNEAFACMRAEKGENDILYIVGSLYLVGQIKECLLDSRVADGSTDD